MSTIHLEKLLNPASIAVIGASDRDGSPGKTIASNIINSGYAGKLYLVNPRYRQVCGQQSFRSINALELVPDIAIVLVPERILRRTLVQIARHGSKVVIVLSAARHSDATHALAQKLGLRLLGPYCAGIIRPHLKLNATYSTNKIATGSLAIVSQSASMGAAILDWAEPAGVGFSALLSTGSDTDVSLPDILDLLAEDQHTRAIIVYVDRIVQPRAFLSAISAAARIKPVVLMKSTQDSAAYCDVITRSPKVYSTEQVVQAAMRRVGVVRVRSFNNLFAAARILTSGMRIKGKRIAIISNGAAPAMLACERIAGKDFLLPQLQQAERDALKKQLRHHWRGNNPVVLRHPDKLVEHYVEALAIVSASKLYDAILLIFVPDARHDPERLSDAILAELPMQTPVLASFMGESSVRSSREKFAQAHIPCFRTPEGAIDAVDFLHRYLLSQQMLLQLPNPASRHTRADTGGAKALVTAELDNGERVLGPQKTRKLLSFFDIDVLQAERVTSLDDAKSAALRIGYPVAMKLVSPNIAYKAEVIGTQLDLADETALAAAYELVTTRVRELRPDAEFRGVLIEAMYSEENFRSLSMSIHQDATFGPVISVGIGGDLTELVHNRAVQLPPLNNYLIDRLLETAELASYLGDFRHRPAVGSVAPSHVLRRLSEMACELPDVFSVHINPLKVSKHGAIAVDAQVVLERCRIKKRYAQLALHPYPWQWVRLAQTKGNRSIQLRPIRPEDGESIRNMVQNMSAESRYFRFMHAINDLSPQMVAQFTKLDYDRQMAFVAVSDSGGGDVVGVSRYAMSTDQLRAEFAVSVADNWQGQGLATMLMKLIIEHAREQGLQELIGDVLKSNTPMQGLMHKLGFSSRMSSEDREVLVFTLPLQDQAPEEQ